MLQLQMSLLSDSSYNSILMDRKNQVLNKFDSKKEALSEFTTACASIFLMRFFITYAYLEVCSSFIKAFTFVNRVATFCSSVGTTNFVDLPSASFS